MYISERVIGLRLCTGLSFCSQLDLANETSYSTATSSDGDLVVVHSGGQIELDGVSAADFSSGWIF